jgi:hypothetical protein
MRPGVLKRALVVVGCGALALTASACQSTESESAKIAREGGPAAAGPSALKLGAANRGVRVSDATLLSSGGRTAVAVKLTMTSSRPQRDVPLLVDVTGKGGKVVYTNGTGGVEAALQRIALLRPHASVWWVDDQVLTSQPGTAVQVRVGTGTSAHTSLAAPLLTTRSTHVGEQSGLSTLSGELVNSSSHAQSKVPVFAVALRAGKVVAAGRAVVGSLAGHRGASAPFQIFLVGSPAGAKLELTAVPAPAGGG